jgi:acyl-CoA thioester hydrolase
VTHSTYEHDIEVQYRDLDPRRHVNHAVYVSYLEQAKGDFFLDVLGVSLAEVDTAVRSLTVDYLAPVLADRTVRVTLGPVGLGETSYTIEYEVVDGDDVAATAQTVSVLLDETGDPRTLPGEWRDSLEPYAAGERT